MTRKGGGKLPAAADGKAPRKRAVRRPAQPVPSHGSHTHRPPDILFREADIEDLAEGAGLPLAAGLDLHAGAQMLCGAFDSALNYAGAAANSPARDQRLAFLGQARDAAERLLHVLGIPVEPGMNAENPAQQNWFKHIAQAGLSGERVPPFDFNALPGGSSRALDYFEGVAVRDMEAKASWLAEVEGRPSTPDEDRNAYYKAACREALLLLPAVIRTLSATAAMARVRAEAIPLKRGRRPDDFQTVLFQSLVRCHRIIFGHDVITTITGTSERDEEAVSVLWAASVIRHAATIIDPPSAGIGLAGGGAGWGRHGLDAIRRVARLQPTTLVRRLEEARALLKTQA